MYTRPSNARHPLWLGLLASSALGACYGAPDSTDDSAQSLNGQPTFPSDSQCDTTEMVRITSALTALRQSVVIDSTALRACMADAFLSPDKGDFSEEIVRRLGVVSSTTVRCRYLRTGAEFSTSPGASDEEITLNHNLFNQSDAHLAASLIHAIAINRGYTEGGGTELAYSVGTQVEQCVERSISGAPGTWRRPRSRMRGEIELQRVGGTGGEPFDRACGGASFITAHRTRLSASGSLNSYGFTCQSQSSSVPSQITVTGEPDVEDGCAIGEVAVGVFGYASARDGYVNQIGLVCVRWSDARTGGSLRYRAERGEVRGVRFERLCPTGTALRGLLGRQTQTSSSWGHLNELRPVCRALTGVSISSPTDLARLGSSIVGATARRTVRQLCTDTGALVGLFGQADADLARLGGICAGVRVSARGVFGPDDGGNPASRAWEHVLPAVGGSGGAVFSGTCASGQVLVGLRAGAGLAGTGVSHVAGVCVAAHTWARTSDTPTSSTLGAFGVDRNNGTTVLCARGELLSGLELVEVTRPDGARVIESVRPLCRRIDDAPSG